MAKLVKYSLKQDEDDYKCDNCQAYYNRDFLRYNNVYYCYHCGEKIENTFSYDETIVLVEH